MNGIPDDVPAGLARSGRVPCYKQIAIAILRNDFTLKSLGFEGKISQYHEQLKEKKNTSSQLNLF